MEIALLSVLGGLSTALITWLIIVVRHYIVEARRKDQIRADGIRGVAEQLGLTYLPDGEALLISELARFKLELFTSPDSLTHLAPFNSEEELD